MSKFSLRDRVWAGRYPGKIVSIRKDRNNFLCTVRFDDDTLIPAEMEYDESNLKLEYSSDKHCPICGVEYKVVKFNMQVWKDCSNCKDTKENLEKKHASEEYRKLNTDFTGKTEPPGQYSDEDLLKEFERILNGTRYSNDDDDDFGTYSRKVL